MTLQLLAVLAYGYAYYKRKMEITARLYKDFYPDFPQFVSSLLIFLRKYDRENIKNYRIHCSIFGICCSYYFFALAYIRIHFSVRLSC
jgi:uncharacterized membrane protein YpjA